MHVIEARNVHEALPLAAEYLLKHGVKRDSRNGPVIVAPKPVTTVYRNPWERVVLWPSRDANPFFHVFEAMWMLAGLNRVAPLLKFVKNFSKFSDDGKTLHDAYGYRWRCHFDFDQLEVIAAILLRNPDDRRCVLQMWDPAEDLGHNGKAVPCNVSATFQRDFEGKLDLTVFCRSNDIMLGAYGANAVQFSVLQEFMAEWIGCPVGTYNQVSVNWHLYASDIPKLETLTTVEENPYSWRVRSLPLGLHGSLAEVDKLLDWVELDYTELPQCGSNLLFQNLGRMFSAHALWRTLPAPQRFNDALDMLLCCDQSIDWVVAATEWVRRRRAAWEAKQ